MKIKTIIKQHRRDFTAIMECEHCGSEELNKHGYDDRNYHDNVIPTMKCKKCGESAGHKYRPLTTKYPEGYTI